ncbi:hypothetical protein [Sorangium sp. So ce124]|uniref:hypothetical protein n=1 Tax=Sorangium sp. So ce124 TaxID=3133280 RepID=UPI003F603509
MIRRNVTAAAVYLASVAFLGGCVVGGDETDPGDFGDLEGGLASAKATYWTGDVAILNQTQLNWSKIMEAKLKTSEQKDLFINAAFVCGLITETTVKSQGGTKDTSTAEAAVVTKVLVDGKEADPGTVTYCKRTQTLSATLSGIMQKCTDTNGDGTILASECQWTPEEISLMLSTTSANAFTWVSKDVGSGEHTIQVFTKIDTSTSSQLGSATAYGSIGKGTLTVTEQRLVK